MLAIFSAEGISRDGAHFNRICLDLGDLPPFDAGVEREQAVKGMGYEARSIGPAEKIAQASGYAGDDRMGAAAGAGGAKRCNIA
ncbi:MAG: hypothetical protein ACREO9_10225, partial [Lysobacterales bacterium]